MPRPFQPRSTGATAPWTAGAAAYTVKRGDTLSHIAKRHQVPLAALLKANPHLTTSARRGGDLIFAGDSVVIPAAPRQPSAQRQVSGEQSGGKGQAAAATGQVEAGRATATATATGTPAAAGATKSTLSPEQAAEVIKPLIESGKPEAVSGLAAKFATALQEEKNVAKLLDSTKNDPVALLETLQDPESVPSKLAPAVAAQGAARAREQGTLVAMRAEVQTQLERPELKAALTKLEALDKLPDDQREAAFQKLSGEEGLAVVAANRTHTFDLALDVQARIEAAQGDPAKLVEAYTNSKPEQLDVALTAVVREAKKLDKLQEVHTILSAKAKPAYTLTEDFKAKVRELQATQGPEVAEAALQQAPPEVLEAFRVVKQLNLMGEALVATSQVAAAKDDATTLAAIALSVPNSVHPFALQEIVEASRARGPQAVAALHDSVVELISKTVGPGLAALRAQPAAKQAAYFAALPEQEQQRLVLGQGLETLRDVVAVEAAVAKAGTDPAKLIAAVTRAVAPEEAAAIVSGALAEPMTAEWNAALMKATSGALESFAPALEKRTAAVRAGTSPEAFAKTLTPAEQATLATAERIAGLRSSVAAANQARLEKELPQNFEETRLKSGEPLAPAAVKALEGQLGLGDKAVFAKALEQLKPKLEDLQSFTEAVTSPEVANSLVGDIPVKALMSSLTPPGGRAELIVPNKEFEVAGGVLDTMFAHEVMIKVVDANNDASFYALPKGARRQMDLKPDVAKKLRAAFEKANQTGDGEAGFLETQRTVFAGLPAGATQAQLNATIELLRKEDPKAHDEVVAAFAYKATFNNYPMNPNDLSTLLTQTREQSPEDFAFFMKGILSDEKLKESKTLEPLLKELASGDDASRAKFKVLQERVAAMATTLPVASVRFPPGADGKPMVALKTSLVGVKEGSTILADVDLGRMKGFAAQHGEALAQAYFAPSQLSDHAPKTYAKPYALENLVAETLELGYNDKTQAWAETAEGQAQLKAGTMPDFAVYPESGNSAVKTVTDQINAITRGRGPDAKPEVELTPLMHLTNDGRTVPVTLFKVTGPNGPMFVDLGGNRYTSFKHYRETNQEAPGTLLAPKDGVLELDEQGQVKVESFLGGQTVTSVASMNWVNENLLTARTMDNASWLLTGAGLVATATAVGSGVGVGMMAIGQGMRTAAVAGTRRAIAKATAKKLAGQALYHSSKLGHRVAAPMVNRLMATKAGSVGIAASNWIAMGGGAGFMGYGLANVVPQIGWVNEHSELGAWDTWSPALDVDTQEGYGKRQLLMGAAMTGLGIVGMGSGLAMSRVLSNPVRVANLMAKPTRGGKALANTVLYSNAINLPVTGAMTADMMRYRSQFGGLMDGEMRSSLDANVMMNAVGGLTGLMTAVDPKALELRGTRIDRKHQAHAAQAAKEPLLPPMPSLGGLKGLLKKKKKPSTP